MLIELTKPAGPELARRWLAVLTLVPESDREGVVRAVERQIHAEFSSGDQKPDDTVGRPTT
ncbi:MAG: hypothetical protein AAGJ54_05420 [Planctomycetota bacterium]